MTSLANKIQDVFNEPGCGKNQGKSEKERKKGCTKQLAPGAAAGGCAFDGAKIALQPITDVAHLVHGPIACEGNSWDNRGAKSSGSRLYRTGFTTDMNENDVVFGGEKRLYQVDQGNHREIRSAGGLRLSDLRARDDRRRHRRRLQGREREIRQAGHPGHFAGLRRPEESRQQARGRGDPRSRDRHASSPNIRRPTTSTSSANITSPANCGR